MGAGEVDNAGSLQQRSDLFASERDTGEDDGEFGIDLPRLFLLQQPCGKVFYVESSSSRVLRSDLRVSRSQAHRSNRKLDCRSDGEGVRAVGVEIGRRETGGAGEKIGGEERLLRRG